MIHKKCIAPGPSFDTKWLMVQFFSKNIGLSQTWSCQYWNRSINFAGPKTVSLVLTAGKLWRSGSVAWSSFLRWQYLRMIFQVGPVESAESLPTQSRIWKGGHDTNCRRPVHDLPLPLNADFLSNQGHDWRDVVPTGVRQDTLPPPPKKQ